MFREILGKRKGGRDMVIPQCRGMISQNKGRWQYMARSLPCVFADMTRRRNFTSGSSENREAQTLCLQQSLLEENGGTLGNREGGGGEIHMRVLLPSYSSLIVHVYTVSQPWSSSNPGQAHLIQLVN
jgi:hypothetical protein